LIPKAWAGWGILTGVAVGAAAIAGAVYLATREDAEGSGGTERRRAQRSPPRPSTSVYPDSFGSQPLPLLYTCTTAEEMGLSQTEIILAVDATPSRAGALIIFPKCKLIEYYSIDWPPYFHFPRDGLNWSTPSVQCLSGI